MRSSERECTFSLLGSYLDIPLYCNQSLLGREGEGSAKSMQVLYIRTVSHGDGTRDEFTERRLTRKGLPSSLMHIHEAANRITFWSFMSFTSSGALRLSCSSFPCRGPLFWQIGRETVEWRPLARSLAKKHSAFGLRLASLRAAAQVAR